MASFQNVIITARGQALMAKMIAGTGNVQFTKISTSSQKYTAAQLEALTSISGVKQTTLVSKVTRTNNTAIKIEGAVNNSELTAGYYCETVGVYATDPDLGEILYGVTIVSGQSDYIPAFNSVTSTGIRFELIVTVGNASSVTLEVNPAAVAMAKDLDDLSKVVTALSARENASETLHGTCGNSASTSAKTVGIPGFVREVGTRISVLMENGNTATTPTLNADSTGAGEIWCNGAIVTKEMIPAGYTIDVIWDGKRWQLLNPATGAKVPFAQVTEAASATAKTAAIPGFVRVTGSIVELEFTNGNSSTAATLEVTSTGAWGMRMFDDTVPVLANVRAMYRCYFVFDGEFWRLLNPAMGHLNGANLVRLNTAAKDPVGAINEVNNPYNTLKMNGSMRRSGNINDVGMIFLRKNIPLPEGIDNTGYRSVISPDGRWLAAVDVKRFWRIDGVEPSIISPPNGLGGTTRAVGFSDEKPYNKYCSSAMYTKSHRLWEISSSGTFTTVSTQSLPGETGSGGPHSIRFYPSSKLPTGIRCMFVALNVSSIAQLSIGVLPEGNNTVNFVEANVPPNGIAHSSSAAGGDIIFTNDGEWCIIGHSIIDNGPPLTIYKITWNGLTPIFTKRDDLLPTVLPTDSINRIKFSPAEDKIYVTLANYPYFMVYGFENSEGILTFSKFANLLTIKTQKLPLQASAYIRMEIILLFCQTIYYIYIVFTIPILIYCLITISEILYVQQLR